MRFYVLKNGNQIGPYSAREMQERLDDGRLLSTDLCWHEGAADWLPIHQVGAVNSMAERVALTVVPSRLAPVEREHRRVRPYYADDHEHDKAVDGFNPATGGWICFAIAILGLVCFSYVWLPVAAVLFFVVFVLSIVALAKGRVASGAIMLCALVIIGPIAGFIAPLILPGFIAAARNASTHADPSPTPRPKGSATPVEEVASDDSQGVTATASARPPPTPPTPAPAAFLADVKYSQQEAVRKHNDLAIPGSPLNKAFITRLAAWKARNDSRLDNSNWPERLADDCATHP